jgi:hypothetical protein
MARLSLSSDKPARFDMVEFTWKNAGYQTLRREENGELLLRGERVGPQDDMTEITTDLLRVPDWLVAYVRESDEQSVRTGVKSTLLGMVQRTGMPADLILMARSLTEWLPAVNQNEIEQDAEEAVAGHKGAAA